MEPLPEQLRQAIQEAHAAINAAPGHELAPEYRKAIYNSLGPPAVSEQPDRVRGILAVLTARHVLPIFEQHLLSPNNRASDLLELGERVLNGTATMLEARTMLHIIKGGQWPNPEMHHAGQAAGYAALRALDEVLGYNGLDYDYDGSDTAWSAAIAMCDGWAFPHKKEPEKLRAFWEWWLLEAIPAAWHASQSPDHEGDG